MNSKIKILAVLLVLMLFVSSMAIFDSRLEANVITIKSSGRASTKVFTNGTYETGCDNSSSSICTITIRI